MIKECKVSLRNSVNMVVLFDNIEIQMPTDSGNASVVYVKYEDNVYLLSSKDEYDEDLYSIKTAKVNLNTKDDSLEENY